MQSAAVFSGNRLAGFILALGCCLAGLLPSDSHAQTCPCNTVQPLGSCLEKKAAYPDLFPGAAAIVPRANGTPLLLIADLYSGQSYRYDATKFDTSTPVKFSSPGGTGTTSGIAYRQNGTEITLFWAVEGSIFSTDSDLGRAQNLGEVKLAELAAALRVITEDMSIEVGTLGGITNHGSTNTLWGVDIVNDVYFEFKDNGDLVLVDGKPHFFFNPKRNGLSGGAYGNSITYVLSEGKEYFDIPVGSLTDRRPSEVHRVHATDGIAPETHKVGDSTGVFYTLGAGAGSPVYATGIAAWQDSCGAGQASEILLDLDNIGGKPQILQVAGDSPTAANVADFACAPADELQVRLTWRKTLPYTTLKITRKNLVAAGAVESTVFEGSDFANDPESFLDTPTDGSFEYKATVTAAAPVPPTTCSIAVGAGSLLAHARFTARPSTTDPTPYAITAVNGDKIFVADLNTSDTQVFDLDLNTTGTVDGPVEEGLTIGLAWDGENSQLYWLENSSGRHYLHATDAAGVKIGSRVFVDSPVNLDRGIGLGDIVYDSEANFFWTVDLLNGVIYAINNLGGIPAEFHSAQIPNPETGGTLGGGIALNAVTATTFTLDVTLGKGTTGVINQIGRFEYNRGAPASKKETARFDLATATGAADFGGIEFVQTGTGDDQKTFEYVVGLDTRTIYKLSMDSNVPPGAVAFRRGDANNDASLNISDPSAILSFLFKGGAAPACLRSADVDGSQTVDITDAVFLFSYLFKGGTAPPAPFPACGFDLVSTVACPAANCN